MKVSIELMSMDSDPGYVSSYGSQEAIIVPASVAADLGGDEDSLYQIQGTHVTEDMLSDVSRTKHRSGVCEYRTIKGVYDVPDGMVVVQKRYVNIRTRDSVEERAFVVNEASLKELYLERADHYRRLADACAAS